MGGWQGARGCSIHKWYTVYDELQGPGLQDPLSRCMLLLSLMDQGPASRCEKVWIARSAQVQQPAALIQHFAYLKLPYECLGLQMYRRSRLKGCDVQQETLFLFAGRH